MTGNTPRARRNSCVDTEEFQLFKLDQIREAAAKQIATKQKGTKHNETKTGDNVALMQTPDEAAVIIDGSSTAVEPQTALQKHVAYFDFDNDGVIWPLDTYLGFRRLGYNIFMSVFSMFIIHSSFSYPTLTSFWPDPFFRIYVARIHKDMHGSDSGSYDMDGSFIQQKFDDIFRWYSGGDKKGITKKETYELIKGRRRLFDPFGWFGSIFEWTATYLLLWPEDGRMKKEDIKGVYDGSIFYEIEAKRKREKNKKH